MSNISQITIEMFECSDGKRFEDEDEAERHELRLVIEKIFKQESAYGQVSYETAADIVVRHRDAIKDALS